MSTEPKREHGVSVEFEGDRARIFAVDEEGRVCKCVEMPTVLLQESDIDECDTLLERCQNSRVWANWLDHVAPVGKRKEAVRPARPRSKETAGVRLRHATNGAAT